MTLGDLGVTEDGRYLLRRAIARGAMGVVYEARHYVTGRRVALKRVSPEHVDEEEFRVRFRREARVLGAAVHPSVVGVLDAVMEGPDPYIVLELLEGRTLEGMLIARGTLPPVEAIDLAIELCDALTAVHGAGVLHRDVKPGNIFVATDARARRTIKLIDFGIAAFDQQTPERAQTLVAPSRPTMPGGVVGTPEYMPPEQLHGRMVDARADLYAVGVTLFEMLSGLVPFAGSFPEVLVKVETTKMAPSIRDVRPDIPEALANVVAKALSYDRADRFASAFDMAKALDQARTIHATPTLAPASPPPERRDPTVMLTDVNRGRLAQVFAAYRRRFARVPYVTPVTVHAGDRKLVARTEDISEGGVLLITQASCEDGEQVEVELALPSTGTIVRIPGVARWARAGRGGKGALGVEFDEIPANARFAIRGLVSRLLPRAGEESVPANALRPPS